MSLNQNQIAFVSQLLGYAKEGSEIRGALADLRSGLGREPGRMARVHKYVVPFLPTERWNDRWYYVLASLFGMHSAHRKNTSMGAAFGPLRSKSDSMEGRFIAMLNAHAEDLPGHLRHNISLLKSNERSLDWYLLFEHLLQWDHPDGWVQLHWARDFYQQSSDSEYEDNRTEIKKEAVSHE